MSGGLLEPPDMTVSLRRFYWILVLGKSQGISSYLSPFILSQ